MEGVPCCLSFASAFECKLDNHYTNKSFLSCLKFPSGSLIAERILAGNRGTLTDNEDHQLSTVFAISTESTPSQGTVYLVLCSANAVTPLTLLISSDHLSPCATLDYGQHRSYRVRLFIVGAIVAHGLFILDAFSRVDLTEVARLPERRLDHTRGHQWPGFAGASRDRKASLITMAGTVMDVDSSSSQVWPLCTGCLSDALKQKASTSNPSTTHLECSRCEARIDRPFHAVEIFVEVTDKVQQRRFKVCVSWRLSLILVFHTDTALMLRGNDETLGGPDSSVLLLGPRAFDWSSSEHSPGAVDQATGVGGVTSSPVRLSECCYSVTSKCANLTFFL